MSGTTPYRGHFDYGVGEIDICARLPKKRKIGERGSKQRRRAGTGGGSVLAAVMWVPHGDVDKWWLPRAEVDMRWAQRCSDNPNS